MGAIAPSKIPRETKKRDGNEPVKLYAKGGKAKTKFPFAFGKKEK